MESQDQDTKPELYNRNFVYLQLLEKRLKKIDYIENHNINVNYFSSSDNTYLLEQDYSEIDNSNNYDIDDSLTKNNTIILKQLLEQNIHHDKIFTPYLEKNICSDQKIYKSFEKIKLRYIGFKQIYNIHEKIENTKKRCGYGRYGFYINEDYYDYIYCSNPNIKGNLTLYDTTLFVFEVLDNYFDKKYIFYSDFSNRFYKTNEFIKPDYITKDDNEFKLQIIRKDYVIYNIEYSFKFLDDQDGYSFVNHKYFGSMCHTDSGSRIEGSHTSLFHKLSIKIEDLYTKVSYTKSIQK
ncbi:hypothetical protein Hokovirus_5_3 [Hokovirus HKV1]|uniref:Uncharacterized protein n=1 Tax=Hokovirus HKV1 TaxID=1977638 RepID=A0A1V0SHH4_9VIRU|nr:hypothetical protein Hokovirus_5_3 [Hokovirus HKV1]